MGNVPIFETKYVGRLMKLELDPNSRFIAQIWFDYTLELMRKIKEGDFVAVPSFASNDVNNKHYIILQIIKKLPKHYALFEDLKGYPGFLQEAAINASKDFFSQVNEATEDTTKIVCEAIPINLGFWDNFTGDFELSYELPVVGEEVYLLTPQYMEKILNKGLDADKEGITEIGHLQYNDKIKILLDIESLLRLHFGIFGFTGAGKSNLISTLVHKILEKAPKGTKIVIFDIMGEYLTLLIDLLIKYPQSKIIGVGTETYVEDIYEYYKNNTKEKLKKASESVLNTNLYPKRLLKYKDLFLKPIKILINREAFRIYDERFKYRDFLRKPIKDIIEEKGGIQASINDKSKIENIYKKYKDKTIEEAGRDFLKELENQNFNPRSKAHKFVEELKPILSLDSTLTVLPEKVFLSIPELVNELNNDEKAIYIVQSHDIDELKKFVKYLTNALYEDRRKKGKITPLVSFILDEADEFIPQDSYAKGESKTSREAIELLARRGRKFGIGIGIATQRVVYLDTNIMAQPHTYFISKLPRKSDRDRVSEAFAVGENIFEQTFKFGKGDWLLISHDATGLESIPFPIHTKNAEERILKFLKNIASER